MKKLLNFISLASLLLFIQTPIHAQLDVSYQLNQPSCYGSGDGTIDLTVSGSSSSISFLWSNGETTEDLINLTAGSYTVTISNNSVQSGLPFDWTIPNTQSFHQILFDGIAVQIPGYSPQCSDYIGAFYETDAGDYQCGGYIHYCECNYFLAWGESFTIINGTQVGNDDGFEEGEELQWKFYRSSDGTVFDLIATYFTIPNLPLEPYAGYESYGTSFISNFTPHLTPLPPTVHSFNLTEPQVLNVDAGNCQTRFIGYDPLDIGNYLVAEANGGTPPFTYQWTPTVSSSILLNETVVVYPDCPTIYSVEVTDAKGCKASDDVFVDVIDVKANCKGKKKVKICHIPPGNPCNQHEICVSINAVPAHLYNHGDHLGACNNPCLEDLNPNKSIAAATESFAHEVQLDVYPNPTQGQLNIDFMLHNDEMAQIMLIDNTGKLVSELFNDLVLGHYNYNLIISTDVPSGIYNVQLILQNEIINKKLMIIN